MRNNLIIAIIALVCLTSCTQKDPVCPVPDGELRIVLSTGVIQTKATTPGDGVVDDGGGIYLDGSSVPDLVILIADSISNIVATYPGANATLQANPTTTEMSVSFTGLSDGTHTVYAFGNTKGLWAMDGCTDLTTLTTASAVEDLQFTALTADTTPALTNSRLPSSAKGTVTVTNGNGEISLEMIRCVAKVTISFVNNTGAALELDGFNFSIEDLSPTTGYVIPYSLPSVPAGIAYGDIVQNVGDDVTFTSGESKNYSFYVFPGTAPDGKYLLNAGFTANNAADASSFTDLPVHDDHAVDITSLERNQHLQIVTRISKGLTVSFNFEVTDWKENEETVHFD
ncbi:MAG: FimB/Mfa2 family fimbrial subunit [Bacteroidales bacterium]|nr:FimB/Mfa2 family fimbrial subunit [Bacteroidales bacterium]